MECRHSFLIICFFREDPFIVLISFYIFSLPFLLSQYEIYSFFFVSGKQTFYLSAPAAITNTKQKKSIVTVLEAKKAPTRPAGLVSGEGPFPGLLMVVSCLFLVHVMAINPVRLGSHPTTSFNLNYLLKNLLQLQSHWGLGFPFEF